MRKLLLFFFALLTGVSGAWADVTSPTFTALNPTTLTSGWYQIQWVNLQGDTNTDYIDSDVSGKFVTNYETDVTVSSSNYPLYLSSAPSTADDHAKTFVYYEKVGNISAQGTSGYIRSANGHYVTQTGAASATQPISKNFIIYFSSGTPTISVITSAASGNGRKSLVPCGKDATPYIGQTVAGKFPNVYFSKVTPTDLGLQPWTVTFNVADGLDASSTQVSYTGSGIYGLTKVYNNGTFFIDSSTTPTSSDFSAPDISGYTATITVNSSTHTISVRYGVMVTYNLYESDGSTFVSRADNLQLKSSSVSIPSSLKSVVSSYEANDYDYATSGTIGTTDCTITVTRTLKSDTYAPSLPSGLYLSVGSKATSMTAATSADDNAHWYIMTQSRDGESAIYDKATYTSNVYRAATTITPTTLNYAPISSNEKYLVRFIEKETGLYYIQFANGNYITSDLKTAQTVNNAGTYAFYKVTSGTYGTDYTFGWNKTSNAGDRVDNNGAGNSVAFWGSGTNGGSEANNVWNIYPVEFVSTVEIAYTLTDKNGATYSGTYRAKWEDSETDEPTISGAYGATLSNKVFSDASGYSLTADITFEFPVSSNSVNNPTAIRSALGNSLWYANDGKVIADNAANTIVYDVYADNYRWYIYPVFSDGTFTFKLYNVGAAKYIPNNPSPATGTATTLTADAASAGAFQYAHYNKGNGFYDTSTSKFLTINTSGTAQNIYLWTAASGTGHMGSAMSFPELVVVSVSDKFAALKDATKFDILDGSTVMGPSEFAAPASINAAIDAAQEVADNNEAKLEFIKSANGKMIQNYLTMNDTYGPLANIQITMSKEYGTLILPCPCMRIDGLDIYSCSAAEGNVLTLTPVDGNYEQNVPYIIHATKGNKYTIIGWDKGSTSTHTSGWLTGVLNSTTDIPEGSYMLATNKSTDHQAFYQIEGLGVKCAINKCYLTVPSGGSVKAFFFEDSGQETAIEEIIGENAEQDIIYNLAGQRLTKVQKGINIINGKKVLK